MKTNFSSLPWFVRRVIIDLVIQSNPRFRVINREWLQQVARQLGALVFSEISISPQPISLFTPHIKRLDLYRGIDIDWDIIPFKNIQYLLLSLCFVDEIDFEAFGRKLLLLPPLKEIILYVPLDINYEISQLIIKSQSQLENLQLECCASEFFPLEAFFPKLINLRLSDSVFPSYFQSHAKKMPALEKLKLSGQVRLNSDKLPNILALDLQADEDNDGHEFKLDISLFPNLRKLVVENPIFGSEPRAYALEELKISLTSGTLDSLYRIEFTKLKILKLDYCVDDFFWFSPLFRHLSTLQTLSTLELNIYLEFSFIANLPEGPYSFTNLALRGPFIITTEALRWLSSCFKLEKLTLSLERFVSDTPLEFVPFKHLKEVYLIYNYGIFKPFEQYFSKKNYPQVETVVLNHEPYDIF